MCPLSAQLWMSVETVGCARLVGPEHILVHSISLHTPFWTHDMGLLTVQVEMPGESKRLA